MSGDKIRKLWKAYQKETPILRVPFRKDINDYGSEVTRYAYVSLLPYNEDDDTIINDNGTPFDYVATIFGFDRSLTPIQYRPIFISESEVFNKEGFLTSNPDLLRMFAKKLRTEIGDNSLEAESVLLPAFDNNDVEILSSDQDIEVKVPDTFGVKSVKRFVSRLNYDQSSDLLKERLEYLPKKISRNLSVGMMMSYEDTLEHLDFLDECELSETRRFMNAFERWDVNWDIVKGLKTTIAASPVSYGYYNANFKKELSLPNGDVKVIYPRKEALSSYPLFANEISRNITLKNAVDQGKSLVPELLREIDKHTGRDVVVGKRLLKTVSEQVVTVPNGWSAYDYMTMLAVVPDSLLPKSAEDYGAMEFCIEVMLMLERETGNSIMTMMKAAKSGWIKLKNKMIEATVNHRLPQGMNEVFHIWLMERLPLDKWNNEEDKDVLRHDILEFVNSIENQLPGDLVAEHLYVWLSAIYAPYDNIEFMRDFIRGMDDVVNLFDAKVAAPLSVHLSGEHDHVLTNEISVSSMEASLEILFYRDRSAVDMLSLIRSVHAEMEEIKSHGIEGLRKQIGDVHVSEYDFTEGGVRRIFRTLGRNEERAMLGLSEDMSWIPLVPTTTEAPNGFKIVPLVTMEDLRIESAHMEHCVGRSRYYEQACIDGVSNIYTILGPDNLRKTTLEIRLNHSDRSVRIAQNQAFRNSHSRSNEVAEAGSAASWFVKQINTGRINAEWPFVRELKAKIKKNENNDAPALTINEMAEYNSASISAVSDAILPWRKYLDKSLRDATIKDFEKFSAIRRTAKMINPYCDYDIKTIENNGNNDMISPKPAWQM